MSKGLEALKELKNRYGKNFSIQDDKRTHVIEKELKALEIIKECFDLNGFDELVPNSKWFESEEKQKLLKEELL